MVWEYLIFVVIVRGLLLNYNRVLGIFWEFGFELFGDLFFFRKMVLFDDYFCYCIFF